LLITMGDVMDIVGSENHVRSFWVLIWTKAFSTYL